MDRGRRGGAVLTRAQHRFAFVPRIPPIHRVKDFYRGFSYGRALLRDPLPSDSAAAIRSRLARRADSFVAMIEQAIFAHAGSPYRPLLDAAGYDLARIKVLTHQEGVEATLRRLAQDGVYVAIEEFKGIREARRGDRTFRFGEKDFHNPQRQPGVLASSGATRSRGIITSIPVTDRRIRAEHRTLVLAAYGLENERVAVWDADAASGLRSLLSFAAMRKPLVRWFVQIPGRVASAGQPHSFYLGIKAAARLYGIAFPRPTYVPFGQESRILRWIAEDSSGRCTIWATSSAALRLALTARRTNTILANTTFFVGAEPLTPAKHAAIRAVGARAVGSFGFTEFGVMAYGCLSPAGPDDMHICRDTAAVIQHERAVDRDDSRVQALLFTALRPDARRTLLNMESGDYGRITPRRCGCPLEAVGWEDHLAEVRSFEKLNAEGWCFIGSRLITLIEETLPAQFGGDPTDYQLLEHEDHNGRTLLSVLVHPRVGAVDEPGVLACVEQALAPTGGFGCVEMYRDLNTLRVHRAAPRVTRAGKLMPLHRLGQTTLADDPERILS